MSGQLPLPREGQGPVMRRQASQGRRISPSRGGCSSRLGAFDAVGDISLWSGVFDAVGDRNPVPGRAGCPRPERRAPGRAECPWPQGAGGRTAPAEMRASALSDGCTSHGRGFSSRGWSWSASASGVDGGAKWWMRHSWERGPCLGLLVTGVRVVMWWLVSRIRLSLRCRGVGRLFLLD